MSLIQVRIITVTVTTIDGEQETTHHPTRVEAEQYANDLLSKSFRGSTASVAIRSKALVVPNSPKRAWLAGVSAGANDAQFKGVAQMIGSWTPDTGWLFKDERAAARRGDGYVNPDDC